ncbi:hypothetical protein DPMN_024362 [Dreissena polymorpha]|uniref:Uncharacterized protein n=1 Tax=Dreissena polymorpha TaxID=45954 RepID=A0A9D4CN89_DREPO|nr:hypothetical protein DPMN_054511 [Dreissena polymorpha]KAH3861433.1 hypothetical protein DPMN_024362 [Dreissena polymorpha]
MCCTLTSFSGSVLSNVFVHHVQHVGLAIKEAYETLAARPPSAAVTQAILIITDKDLTSTVKGGYLYGLQMIICIVMLSM